MCRPRSGTKGAEGGLRHQRHAARLRQAHALACEEQFDSCSPSSATNADWITLRLEPARHRPVRAEWNDFDHLTPRDEAAPQHQAPDPALEDRPAGRLHAAGQALPAAQAQDLDQPRSRSWPAAGRPAGTRAIPTPTRSSSSSACCTNAWTGHRDRGHAARGDAPEPHPPRRSGAGRAHRAAGGLSAAGGRHGPSACRHGGPVVASGRVSVGACSGVLGNSPNEALRLHPYQSSAVPRRRGLGLLDAPLLAPCRSVRRQDHRAQGLSVLRATTRARSICATGVKRNWRNDDLQSFTPLRFMPPELMGYQGRAVVVDPDVFAVGDVFELLTPRHARARRSCAGRAAAPSASTPATMRARSCCSTARSSTTGGSRPSSPSCSRSSATIASGSTCRTRIRRRSARSSRSGTISTA